MREATLAALDAGDVTATVVSLRSLVAGDRTRRTLTFVERCLDRLPETDAITRLSVHVLRSTTLDPLVGYLRAHGLAHGIDVRVRFGEFNQFEQELAGVSALGTTAPDVLIVFARLEDLAPDLAHRFIGIGLEGRAARAAEVVARIESWLDTAERRWPRTRLVITNFAEPARGAFGLAETSTDGQRRAVRAINAEIERICRTRGAAYVFDLDAVLANVGRSHVLDGRRMASACVPYSDAALDAIGGALARVLAAGATKRRKCLVLDCDNTLWGGVIAEDGIDGIKLGPEHPGSAWVAFQRVILNLHDRGVILALNSKNDDNDVVRVLEEHPFQVLRTEHFAARRVNWQDKATNLMELADEINIGLDAMVFVDDSDFECAWVRERLPEVAVRRLPGDPLALAAFVDDMDLFDALTVSAEDMGRGRMYQAELARNRELEASSSLEDFLCTLDLRVTVSATAESQVLRVAQLTQRTNQFNLTTRRYTEADIRAFLGRADTDVFHVSVSDRFGEYGTSGALITRVDGASLCVDTLLLSCRVLGRRIEDALISFLFSQARRVGAEKVVGEYRPTAKNGQTAEFYVRFGFATCGIDGEVVRFELASHHTPEPPAWIVTDFPSRDIS